MLIDLSSKKTTLYKEHLQVMITGVLSGLTYGVNYVSALNSLEYFHVANNQLPQDVMHILLHGVIPYTMKCTLKRFICENNYFTIDFLNDQITCFPFSHPES